MDEMQLEHLAQLRKKGFYCSQILLILGMEYQGKKNPDLVRAMHGLAGGLGFSGEICGALSGGACLLGLYAGKGLPEEQENPLLNFMIEDLVKWFKQEHGQRFGGIRCEDILDRPGVKHFSSTCPTLVLTTLQKVKELLVENGFDLAGTLDD